MANFQKVASLSDLKEGAILGLEVEGESIALYRVGDGVFATGDECPHAACSLSEYGEIEGDEVECSCHGSRFRIRSGATTAPPATDPLQIFPVEIREDGVYVELS